MAPREPRPPAWAGLAVLALALLGGCARPTPPPTPAPTPPLVKPPRVLLVPASEPPARRLVVYLHGYGDDADGFLPLAQGLAAALPDADAVVPDAHHPRAGGGRGREWFSREDVTSANRAARLEEAGQALSAWLDGELDARGLDGRQLVVIGFSQGAMLAQWLALRRTPAPATVVSLSGLLAVPGEGAVAPGTRLLLVHGDADRAIPSSESVAAFPKLTARGVQAKLQVISGLGHAIDDRVLGVVRDFLAR